MTGRVVSEKPPPTKAKLAFAVVKTCRPEAPPVRSAPVPAKATLFAVPPMLVMLSTVFGEMFSEPINMVLTLLEPPTSMVAPTKLVLTETSLPKARTALSPKFERRASKPPLRMMAPAPRTFAWPLCWKPIKVPLLRMMPPDAVVFGWA